MVKNRLPTVHFAIEYSDKNDHPEGVRVAAFESNKYVRCYEFDRVGVSLFLAQRIGDTQIQGLANGTPEQLAEVEIVPTGSALHWESLDADLGVPQLVSGLFGSKAWMTELDRSGGHSKLLAKTI